MGLGTNHHSATTLAAYINEVWSPRINEYFKAKLGAADFFWDVSELAQAGGDTIHIPNLSELSTNNKAAGSQVTLQNTNESRVSLGINTWKEASVLIERKEALQVLQSVNLQEKYLEAEAYAVKKSYDAAIMSLYSGLSQSVGDYTTAVIDSEIRQALGTLDAADVPLEECAFFFHPTVFWNQLEAIAKYYDISVLGQKVGYSPIVTGKIPMLYGLPTIVSSQVVKTGADEFHNLVAHRDAFAHARSGELNSEAEYVIEYKGVLSSADLIFGVVENRDATAVEIKTDDTLTT